MIKIDKKHFISKQIRIAIFIILILILYVIYTVVIHDGVRNNIDVGTDVNVEINGKLYEHVDLNTFNFGDRNTGDYVNIDVTLPQSDIVGAMIEFKVYHCSINAYIDDDLIYSFGNEYVKKGVMTGSGTHFLSLPDNYQGKHLVIKLYVTEQNAFTTIQSISFQSQFGIIENFIQGSFLQIITSVFMLGIGIMLIGVVIVYGDFSKEYRTIIWMALISISASIWVMSTTGIIQLFVTNFRMIGYLEFLSLDFLLLFFLAFIYELHYDRKIKLPVGGLIVIMTIFIITSLICDALNIAHLPAFLTAYHTLAVFVFFVTIIASFLQWRKNRDSAEGILLKGIVVVLIVLVLDLIRFNGQKYVGGIFAGMTVSILPIGIVVFIVSMFAMYIVRMVRSFHENIEKQTLMHIAYTDVLTGVANRAKCEDMLADYNEKVNEYTIFNFDLNNFKGINDTYGHATGDNLLIDFATVANKVFAECGFFGRMGGDEFIGLIEGCDDKKIDSLMERLQTELNVINDSNKREYKISVSFGYKKKEKSENITIWDAYKLADKNMYEYKQEYKKSHSNEVDEEDSNADEVKK